MCELSGFSCENEVELHVLHRLDSASVIANSETPDSSGIFDRPRGSLFNEK
jgi:hypothetical protein